MSREVIREQFLKSVLPEGNFDYFIVTRPSTVSWMKQRPAPSIKTLAAAAEKDSALGDVYFAISGFKKGARRRDKGSVVELRTLAVDIDDKVMPGADALTRHENSRRLAFQIPTSFAMVDSGNGFHIYVPLPEDKWLSKFASQAEGVRALEILQRALVYYLEDRSKHLFGSQVALDRAIGVERIWRVPFTRNLKREVPVEVNLVLFCGKEPSASMEWGVKDIRFLDETAERATKDHDGSPSPSGDVDLPSIDGLPSFDTSILPTHLISQWPMDSEGVDQSTMDYRIVCSLIERGYVDDPMLASAIVSRRMLLSDPGDRSKGRRFEYVRTTIARAKAHVSTQDFAWVESGSMLDKKIEAEPREESNWRSWEFEELLPHLRKPYKPILPEEHFVTRYVRAISERTDAPYCYHEGLAFLLLGVATPNVEIRLRHLAGAMGTNLYMVLLGDSGTSRKSTSLDHARQVLSLQESIGEPYHGFIAARSTPERMIERLGEIRHDSALWHLDELQSLMSDTRRSYMSAMRGLVLELYSKRAYDYERASSRDEDGKIIENVARIRGCYFNIMTAATGAIYSDLYKRDVQDGFMPRFVVISDREQTRPRTRGGEQDLEDERMMSVIARQWHDIYAWAHQVNWADPKGADKHEPPRVFFQPGSMRELQRFGNWIEHQAYNTTDQIGKVMVNRAMDTATKLAVLVRIGRDGGIYAPSVGSASKMVYSNTVMVTEEDTIYGCEFAHRWAKSALEFGQGFYETEQMADLAFVREIIKAYPGLGLTDIRRRLQKLPRNKQDELLILLIEQDDIHVVIEQTKGRPMRRYFPGPAKK